MLQSVDFSIICIFKRNKAKINYFFCSARSTCNCVNQGPANIFVGKHQKGSTLGLERHVVSVDCLTPPLWWEHPFCMYWQYIKVMHLVVFQSNLQKWAFRLFLVYSWCKSTSNICLGERKLCTFDYELYHTDISNPFLWEIHWNTSC